MSLGRSRGKVGGGVPKVSDAWNKRRGACALLAWGHCGGDRLEAQDETRKKCVSAISYTHTHTQEQPSLTQPLWPALPQLSREMRLPTHTDTSSLSASQFCLKCGGSVLLFVQKRQRRYLWCRYSLTTLHHVLTQLWLHLPCGTADGGLGLASKFRSSHPWPNYPLTSASVCFLIHKYY